MTNKEDDLNITKICWNNMEKIQEGKIMNLVVIYQYFSDLKKKLNTFANSYKEINIEEQIYHYEDSELNQIILNINKTIRLFNSLMDTTIDNIRYEFRNISKMLEELVKKYNLLSSTFSSYKTSKEKMDEDKIHFIEKINKLEDSVKIHLEKKNNGVDNYKPDKKLIGEIYTIYSSLKKEASDSSKLKNDNDEGKKIIFNYYNQILKQEPELYQKMVYNSLHICKDFINHFTNMQNTSTKLQEQYNQKDYQKKIVDNYQNEGYEDFSVLSYYLKFNPYKIYKKRDKKLSRKYINLRNNIMKTIKKSIKDSYPNVDLDIQEAPVEVPDIILEFLSTKLEMTENNKNQIINMIKDDYSLYPQVLILLNRYRCNSKLYSSEEHIKFLGEILIEILHASEEMSDYSAAKNCIILSQTYCYKDKQTNKKKYLIDKIKMNKWLNSEDFWKEFINHQIKIELEKFELLNNLTLEIDGEFKIPKELLGKVKEIVFASLVTYITNMKEFNINKKYIMKIIEELLEKYNCLDEQRTEDLYQALFPNKEELKKIINDKIINP